MSSAIIYKIHADHPEAYKIAKVAATLQEGGLVLYPTDTVYGVCCDPRNKSAVERLRALKGQSGSRLLTLLCPSLSDISTYAHVDDAAFRLMRSLTPGPYTFILKGTKEMPRLVLDPKRKTAGLRVPDHPACQALLERLGAPLVTTSAKLPESEEIHSREELFKAFEHQVEAILDDGSPLHDDTSTIIDLTTPNFEVIREGLGMEALAPFMR